MQPERQISLALVAVALAVVIRADVRPPAGELGLIEINDRQTNTKYKSTLADTTL
jgi:hypothetical protein